MSNMQIKVTRKREDATNARDYRLLFSSGWPTLEPIAHGLIRSGTTAGTVITRHGLGFRPMFLLWDRDSGNLSVIRNYLNGYFSAPVNDGTLPIVVDNDRMYVETGATTTTYDRYYTIFNLDLDAPFGAENYSPGAGTENNAGGGDFVVRITQNKEARPNPSKNDPRDFVVNTDYQPIPIHKVVQTTKPENVFETIRIPHGLDYAPDFYIYGNVNGSTDAGYKYMEIAPDSSNGIFAYVNSEYLQINITAPLDLRIVILKDPIV